MKSYHEHFVVQQDADGNLSAFPAPSKEEELTLMSSGLGVINYLTRVTKVQDRSVIMRSDIAEECLKLMLDITTNRSTSSPQCIPISLYRRLEKLTQQYNTITNGEKKDE